MLNEWEDRAPEPRKGVLSSRQFWAGAICALVVLAMVIVMIAP